MPELPDLTVYLEHLDRRIVGETLLDIRLASPFVLRSVSPSVDEVRNRTVTGSRRLAKQLVIALEPDVFMVVHLMISGRLRWYEQGRAVPKRAGLAAFDFSSGTLIFTEASKKKRAALRLVRGEEALAELDPGGLEVFDIDLSAFRVRLASSHHTLKRTLTDQRIFAGIGNTYSDEILLHAGPVAVQACARHERRGGRTALQCLPEDTHRLDRHPARQGGRCVSGQGDGVS